VSGLQAKNTPIFDFFEGVEPNLFNALFTDGYSRKRQSELNFQTIVVHERIAGRQVGMPTTDG
jgi:hypothetical protein